MELKSIEQDLLFLDGEGDAWFRRNKDKLFKSIEYDPVLRMFNLLKEKTHISSIIELGCSNGWRLAKLAESGAARSCGIDASLESIEDGRTRFPKIQLEHALLSDVPFQEAFDLAIVSYVLHWVDRSKLLKSISEIDRLIADGGYLILADFLPDFPERRFYHHRLDVQIYTYKQDYSRLFESAGTYKEIAFFTYDHDRPDRELQAVDSISRGSCSLLRKSVHGYYASL